MPFGGGCGAQLTGPPATGAANAVRLAMWRQTHGEPDARAFRRPVPGGHGFEGQRLPAKGARDGTQMLRPADRSTPGWEFLSRPLPISEKPDILARAERGTAPAAARRILGRTLSVLRSMFFGTVSTVQDACSGCDSWAGIPVRQTPARAVDALRLGLRWLAHQPRDARTLYKMPEPAGSLTSSEQLGPTRDKLESQAWTPPGRRMLCGWRCGSRLTASGMRALGVAAPNPPLARCARTSPYARSGRRPSDHGEPASGNPQAKRGRPPGRRMLCGWRCGSKLTASGMRSHFVNCARRPWV
jgi:hypothetical protein